MRNFSDRENTQKTVSMIGIKTAGGSFYPIVEENSGTKKKVILATANDNQRRVRISLFRSASREMDGARRVGSLVVDGITPRPKGQSSIELVISSAKHGGIVASVKDTDASRRESQKTLKVSLAPLPLDEEKDEVKQGAAASGFAADFLSALPEYSGIPPGLYEASKEKKKLPWQVFILIVIASAAFLGLALCIFFFEKSAAGVGPGSGKFLSLPDNLQNNFARPAAVEAADIQAPLITENPARFQAEMKTEDQKNETSLFFPPVMTTKIPLEVSDLILSSYRDPAFRNWTLGFFRGLTGSHDVALEVLAGADAYGVNPALAFALCAEESSYNPEAINRHNRNSTIDRGLFQLNSATFSTLEIKEFYDPGINADNGISHLAWCLEYAGSEGAALAVYNTGSARVRSGKTAKTTLDYITRILNRRHKIEKQFMIEYIRAVLTRACLIIDSDNSDNGLN